MEREDIERQIKKRKILKSDFPDYVIEKITEALEDSGDDNFRTGKEEGRAEMAEEIRMAYEPDEDTEERINYSICIVRETIESGGNLASLLKELELRSCKFM